MEKLMNNDNVGMMSSMSARYLPLHGGQRERSKCKRTGSILPGMPRMGHTRWQALLPHAHTFIAFLPFHKAHESWSR